MDGDKKTEHDEDEKLETPTPAEESTKDASPETPVDALSRTPEDLEEEAAKQGESEDADDEPAPKKLSPIKAFFRKVNVYFLVFVLLIIIAGAITVVNYLNSETAPPLPDIANQELTEEALQQLANTDASVGNTSQTLTIQGNAIIAGQTLARGNLDIAGNFQTGGSIQGPSITISGAANLGDTQINSLQVATDTAIQGTTTLRDLNVAGSSSFSGPILASQITVTRLIMSGNAILEIPNHISFTGPSPSRSVNTATLGAGGTVSLDGSDSAGTININTGNNPAAGCFTRVTFQQPFPSQPHVVISPVGPGAAQTQYYVDRNTTGFSVCTANAAPSNQAFSFDYFVSY